MVAFPGMAVGAREHRRRWLAGLAWLLPLGWGALAAGSGPTAAPTRLGPGFAGLLAVDVEYRARKIVFSSDTRARIELRSAASVRRWLRTPPTGAPIPIPAEGAAVLTVETSLPLGRHEVSRIVLDTRTGRTLQGDRLATGRGSERAVCRYLEEGVYCWLSQPGSRREEKMDPDTWTERRERLFPYPASIPRGAVVTDGYAVLPLAEAARLDRPRAAMRLYTFSPGGFAVLDFTRQGLERSDLELEEQAPSGRRIRSGSELLRAVRVSAHTVGAPGVASPHDPAVLGFEGGVTLLLDPATGVPLGLTGRARFVGDLTARLVRVTYAADPPRR